MQCGSEAHSQPMSFGTKLGSCACREGAMPQRASAATHRTSSSSSSRAASSTRPARGKIAGSRSVRTASTYLSPSVPLCRTCHVERPAISSRAQATSEAASNDIHRSSTGSACAAVSRTGAVTLSPEAQSNRSSARTHSSRMLQSASHVHASCHSHIGARLLRSPPSRAF